VKRYVDTTGRWTDIEVEKEIEYQTQDVYEEVGMPIAAMMCPIESDENDIPYRSYYLGETNIYAVERFFLGTATKYELTETEDFQVARGVGMVKFVKGTVYQISSSASVALDPEQEILIYYVPQLFSKYCSLKVAEALLQTMDTTDTGKVSRELKVIQKRLQVQERLLNNRLGVAMSSSYAGYDPIYGVNLKTISQDHAYNQYMWKED
jgi:hypothetical protein